MTSTIIAFSRSVADRVVVSLHMPGQMQLVRSTMASRSSRMKTVVMTTFSSVWPAKTSPKTVEVSIPRSSVGILICLWASPK